MPNFNPSFFNALRIAGTGAIATVTGALGREITKRTGEILTGTSKKIANNSEDNKTFEEIDIPNIPKEILTGTPRKIANNSEDNKTFGEIDIPNIPKKWL